MSVLIFSDPHAHAWPRFSRVLPDGTNSRLADLLSVLSQIEQYARQYDARAVCCLGDVTHRRYFVQFSVYNRLLDALARLQRAVRGPLVVLVGNHDIEAGGVHSLHPLRYLADDVRVVDTPQWLDLPGLGQVYAVPYMEDGVPEAVREPVASGRLGEPAAAFLHYALDGTPLGEHEYQVRTPLRLSDLGRFPRVYLGHVHRPQVLGHALYVGAPMHFDFGDHGDRYAWLVERDRPPVPLPLSAPRFVTGSYPRIGLKGFAEPGYLRVLNVPRGEFEEVAQHARQLGWDEVLCQEAPAPSEAVRVVSSGSFLSDGLLAEYVARHAPDLPETARAQLLAAGRDLLQAAEGRV